MILINILLATIFFVVSFVVQLLGIISGLFVVPIALLFPDVDKSKQIPFKYPLGFWYPVHLKKIFWLWGNEKDGFRGDHQGRWWNRDSYSWLNTDYKKMVFWGAIRNPANNLKRLVLGCDVRHYVITTLVGNDFVRDNLTDYGFQFVKATPVNGHGFPRYHLYWVVPYGKSGRGLVIELGNKVRKEHNQATYDFEQDYFKGVTWELNPVKDIS